MQMRNWLVGLAAAVLLGAAAPSAAATGSLPVIYNGLSGYSHVSATASPLARTTGRASRAPRIRGR